MRTFGKAKGGGRRKAARSPAPLLATLSTVTDDYQVGLVNLSSTGARLRGPRLPLDGDEVIFRAERVQSFARVAWVEGQQCGIAFEAPMPGIDVDRLRDDPKIWRLCDLAPNQELGCS